MFKSCQFFSKLYEKICAFCLISKERINQCSFMSNMYNLCINKFDNVLICTDAIKADHKCMKEKKLIKNKFKKIHDYAESESSSKNSYQ